MKTNYNKKDIILNAKQVSEYLHIPLRTIHHLSKHGKIRSVKIGKHWRYLKSDIEQYFSIDTNFSKEPVRMPNNFIERRANPRINTNFRCQYSISLPPFKEINSEGIIKNLSVGGVFLINQNNEINDINIDDPIDLDFNLIAKDKTININTEGKIVRKENAGLGIKFRNIDGETRNKIICYVG